MMSTPEDTQLSQPIDLKLASKYLIEYALVVQGEALRTANVGLTTEINLFEKAAAIKLLGEQALLCTVPQLQHLSPSEESNTHPDLVT